MVTRSPPNTRTWESDFTKVHGGRDAIVGVPPLRRSHTAEVAELADALASGASGRKAIGVRVPASAPLDSRQANITRGAIPHQ